MLILVDYTLSPNSGVILTFIQRRSSREETSGRNASTSTSLRALRAFEAW